MKYANTKMKIKNETKAVRKRHFTGLLRHPGLQKNKNERNELCNHKDFLRCINYSNFIGHET